MLIGYISLAHHYLGERLFPHTLSCTNEVEVGVVSHREVG